ncbi:MAG TPA: carboxypeptidase-like regulatory domain-containing protein [Blastocatellia bacterium]|nr:carboxypeptidase-like regulatory domain-containing protein [Blastocatellia bacterium]
MKSSRDRLIILSIALSTIMLSTMLSTAAAAGQTTGVLKGKIQDEKGKPISGAEVRVTRNRDRFTKDTRTDEAGAYSFELEPDDYVVSFDAEGFQGGTLVQMQQVEAGKENVVKTIRLEKARKKTSLIRGAVFDAGGRALAGVKLKLVRVATAEEEQEHRKPKSLSMDYISNSRGEFAFRLPAQRARYKVTVTANGYKTDSRTVDVNEDESVPLAFSLEPVKKQSDK